MAQEIERYLMEKFQTGLDGNDKSMLPRYNQFKDIKTSLEEIFCSGSPVGSSIKDKLYYLNNVLIECQMLSRKRIKSPEELLTIVRIRRELNKIKNELKVMKQNKGSSHGNVNQQEAQPNNGESSSHRREVSRWSTRSVDASKVYGFDDEVLSMEKLLFIQGRDDRFKAVGIVGIGGIGKTTLCQLIFNKQEVRNNFLPRIWVCMARQPDDDDDPKIAIVQRMLKYLGVEEEIAKSVSEKHGLAGLLCALHLQLVGKRYLIVLDDARETDSWYGQLNSCLTGGDKKWEDGLAFGLPKGYGGRVIVTSRNEDIAKMMVGEENIHHLLPLLDPESCGKIFKDSVEQERTIPPNWEDLKLEIEQKCGGLPLAAKMMGQAMQPTPEATDAGKSECPEGGSEEEKEDQKNGDPREASEQHHTAPEGGSQKEKEDQKNGDPRETSEQHHTHDGDDQD